MDTNVLIVGAGPTGLMLANQLARRGVRTMIIDRHSGPAQQTRAMAVQARTMEIYSKLGIADRAMELGKRGNGANMWANGKRAARIPIGDIGKGESPFPFVLMLGQDDNERIMGEKLRDWNMEVQWNTELIAIHQQPDHVKVTLKQPDGSTRNMTAMYIAGCDGAKSPVRELSGITFPGAPYEQVFFVADTVATGDMVPDELNIYMWRDGFHLLFPMIGSNHWRVVGILPPQLRHRDNVTFEEVIPSIRQQAGASLNFESCSWFSTYRIHHRCAETFRDHRCFLLGDAAHIHSPAGGQGMNTGLQDAYNLAWKLALVINGQADAALLDTYEAERRPVAQRLLDTTDRAFTMLVSDGWMAGTFRTRILAKILALAMTRERVQKLAFRTISQTGIRYRGSALSQTLAGVANNAPHAGDRFPWLKLKFSSDQSTQDLYDRLDDTRYNLLVTGQPAPKNMPDFGGLLRVHAAIDNPSNRNELTRAHIVGPAFYLLRPDGHVALAGTHLEPAMVQRYFAEHHIHAAQQTAQHAAQFHAMAVKPSHA